MTILRHKDIPDNDNTINFSSIETPSIVISKISDNQYHLGLLYKDIDRSNKILHLSWHLELNSDYPSDKYFVSLFKEGEIHYATKTVISSRCRTFLKKHLRKGIKYGFSKPENSINSSLDINDEVIGLTCATLVLSILSLCGVKLLEYNTWSILEEDQEWQNKIISMLMSHHQDYQHIMKLKEQVGKEPRFTPLQVFSAIPKVMPPIEFKDALVYSEQIKEKINFILNNKVIA